LSQKNAEAIVAFKNNAEQAEAEASECMRYCLRIMSLKGRVCGFPSAYVRLDKKTFFREGYSSSFETAFPSFEAYRLVLLGKMFFKQPIKVITSVFSTYATAP
jgi:hypothetical protein